MDTKLDRFGRVVIPKRVRDRLALSPGTRLEVTEEGQRIVLRPIEAEPHLVEKDGVLVFRGKAAGDLSEALRAHRRARIRDLSERGGR